MSDHAEEFWRKSEVAARTAVSASTLWRWERAGSFPKRVRVGPNAVAWRASDVIEWMRSRPGQTPAPDSAIGNHQRAKKLARDT